MASVNPLTNFLRKALLASGLLLIPAHAYADPRMGGPFSGLAGRWSGSGTITMANGASERIRCRATSFVDSNGEAMRQTLRCASQSYRLDISSDVVSEGGSVSGQWAETTRGVSGSVYGRSSAGGIFANIMGANFAASLYVRNQGDRQSVTIRPSAGTDVAAVSIALRKG